MQMSRKQTCRVGRLALFVLIFCCFFTFLALPETQGQDLMRKLFSPASPESKGSAAVPFDPRNQFTITQVEANMKGDRVKLTFTESCSLPNLRKFLKIFPPVKIDWPNIQFGQNEITIKGDFKPGQEYTILLPETLECNGRRYVKTVNTFKMPDLVPDIHFLENATVVERNSRQMIHVSVTNIDEFTFQGLQIPPVLIPSALRELKAKSSFEKMRGTLDETYRAVVDRFGTERELEVFMGEVKQDRQLFFPRKEPNRPQQFSAPLIFRANREQGAIEIIHLKNDQVESRGVPPIRIYRITDLGVTYKTSDDTLLVWITSLNSGKPVKDVSLLAFLRDGSMVLLGHTDQHGVLQVKNLENKLRFFPEGGPRRNSLPLLLKDVEILAAASSSDRTFVDLKQGEIIKPDWITQSPAAGERPSLLKGHVFTERGIYRPGERVFFKGTVREYRDGNIVRPSAPSNSRPLFLIHNSKEEEVFRREITLSEFGTATDSFDVKPYFPLGTYTVKMQLGPMAVSSTFEVQEFRAPRHFVEILFKRATQKDESYVNLQREINLLSCTISGKYYAGGPVKHGKVRWKTYYTGTQFRAKDYPQYVFGNALERSNEFIESGESILDDQGQLTVTVPVSKEVLAGLYGVEVVATVLDFDGRASTETSVYQEEPDFLLGLSAHDRRVKAGDPQVLNVIVIHKDGRPVETGTISVEVLRNEHLYVRKRNESGDVYWEHKEVFKKQTSTALKIEKNMALFDFDFVWGGKYLLKFTYTTGEGKGYASSTLYDVEGYFYGYEYESRERKFERLSVLAEKKEYAIGETLRVFINPHKKLSSLLMTVERQGILQYRTVDLSPNRKFIDIPVDRSFEPNVYISFLGIVARGDFPIHGGQFDDEAPQFLFGVVNVDVRKEFKKLKLAINEDLPQMKAEPGTDFRLTLSVRDEAGKGVLAEMAVAVVDESVLALTGFKTPVLETLLRFSLPLSVFTGDLRSELLRQTPFGFIRNEPLTGGGGLAGKDFSTTKLRKDFRPVAYCNMALRTDQNGDAQVEFKLPDTMTTYRVYVVACDPGSQFVSHERSLLVVKDFYLEAGTPSFFTRGDRFKFYVSAFNKTAQPGTARFNLKDDALMKLTVRETQSSLKPYDRTLFPVEGESIQPGISTALFAGRFSDKEDAVEIKVPIKSGYLSWNDVVFGTMRNQARITYTFPEGTSQISWNEINPGEVQALFTVSGSPFVRLSKALRYLLRYPYGCVEQTSSGVMPLAALRGLIKDGFILEITLAETDKFLKPGVERLLSMQTDNGGFGYWAGDLHPSPWGSIYAASALTQARAAGLDVPQDKISKAMRYLQEAIQKEARNDEAFKGFASYVLALNNSLDGNTFREVHRDLARMPREAVLPFLLAAKMGKYLPEGELTELTRQVLERRWDPLAATSFYAVYREPAMALLAGSAILGDDPLVGRLAQRLMEGMNRQGIWTSTSDTGWALLALGDYFKGKSFSQRPASITLRQAGQPAVMDMLEPNQSITFALDAASFLRRPELTLSADANVDLITMLSLTFPRVDYASQGHEKGFKIRKTMENMDGSKEIKVGDVVKVKLEVDVEDDYTYLVIDDPLPAGLVAINSAIKTEERVGTKKKRSSEESEGGDGDEWDVWWEAGYYQFIPSFFEIRDDRVLVFKDRAWKGPYQYAYYARAVCEGEFVIPSTKIQLMYEPSTLSLTPVDKVTIKGRE